ncbi:MAG: hypothetical protein WEC99_03130 [Halofilum sp. (in: g-proteobacteria)]
MWKDLDSNSVGGAFTSGPFSSARPGLSAEIDAALGNVDVIAWLTPDEIAQIRDLKARGEALHRQGKPEASEAAFRWAQAILAIN